MPKPTRTGRAVEKPVPLFHQIRDLDNRFWIVNVMEMFERLAYYGVRAVVAIYMVLPLELGGPEFSHTQKGTIFAWWAAVQSVLPMFTGGYADRYGHKRTIAVAIILKIIGYALMAWRMDFAGFMAGCLLLAAGTAIFKPGVQGTLAATLKEGNASVGWGIFYQLVNIGGFLGPVLAGVLRILDWQYVFLACAGIVAINFLWLPFYTDPTQEPGYTQGEGFENPLNVLITSVVGIFRPRVLAFCLVFSGFWFMFNQVFDLLPNVIDDWMDSSGIILAVGNAFATPAFPTALALVLGLVYGGVCAFIVILAMRPDRREAAQVPTSAYAVVAIGWTLALLLGGLWLDLGGAIGLVPLLAVGVAVAGLVMRLPGPVLAGGAAVTGAATGFLFMRNRFLASSEELVAMAQAGAQVPPEWMINLNPGLIVFTMIFFAWLSGMVRPLTSIIIGMIIATLGSVIAGTAVIGWVCLAGILVFSVGEMLSSPKKMEYLATLSPKGQEGLFMGYANIPAAIGWISGSIFAGNRYEEHGDKANLARKHLVEVAGWTPETAEALPRSEVLDTLAAELGMTAADAQRLLFETYHPEAIWLDIGLIGLASIVGMVVYDRVIRWYDGKSAA